MVPDFPNLTQEVIHRKLTCLSGDADFFRPLQLHLQLSSKLLSNPLHEGMLEPLLRVAQADSMLTALPAQLQEALR